MFSGFLQLAFLLFVGLTCCRVFLRWLRRCHYPKLKLELHFFSVQSSHKFQIQKPSPSLSLSFSLSFSGSHGVGPNLPISSVRDQRSPLFLLRFLPALPRTTISSFFPSSTVSLFCLGRFSAELFVSLLKSAFKCAIGGFSGSDFAWEFRLRAWRSLKLIFFLIVCVVDGIFSVSLARQRIRIK